MNVKNTMIGAAIMGCAAVAMIPGASAQEGGQADNAGMRAGQMRTTGPTTGTARINGRQNAAIRAGQMRTTRPITRTARINDRFSGTPNGMAQL